MRLAPMFTLPLFGACTPSGSSDTVDPERQAVIGGHEAAPGQFPWQASLQFDRTHTCGGVIVSERHVLTAAHCFDGARSPNTVEVGMGVELDGPDRHDFAIVEVFLHGGFRPDASPPINDLAVVEVDITAAALTEVGTAIPMIDPRVEPPFASPGAPLTVSGWGLYEGGRPDTLRYGDLTVNDSASQPEILWAGGDGVDACKGDSGGPLVTYTEDGPVLMGLVSFGDVCPSYWGGYVRLAAYRSWVSDQVPEAVFYDDPTDFWPDDHGDVGALATPVDPFDSTVTGVLEHGWDTDVFAIELSSPATLDIRSFGEARVDAQLVWADAPDAPAIDNEYGLGHFRMVTALDAGRYLLRVEAESQRESSAGPYALTLITQ